MTELWDTALFQPDPVKRQHLIAGLLDNIDGSEHNELHKRNAFDGIVRNMLYRDPSAAAHWIANQQEPAHLTGHAIPQNRPQARRSRPSRPDTGRRRPRALDHLPR